MAYRLVWSPLALSDLRATIAYVSEDDVAVAKQFAQQLILAVERLASFPESGRIVPEFDDVTIREVIRRPYRIVYRVIHERAQIEILRLWHAARGTPDVGESRN